MGFKIKRLAVTLTIAVFLIGLIHMNMKITFSESIGGKIDLYTQNEPYSGKGPNMPSDAFEPGKLVVLYALVTYNEAPVQNLIVNFYVQSPNGSIFYLTEKTDETGIARVNFTIPYKSVNVTDIFGVWFVSATVAINGNNFQDTLSFKVDWIVKLLSVKTIDGNLTERNAFGIGGYVGLEVTLRNIAMTTKNATIAITIEDELMVPISSFHINDFELQSNEKIVKVYFKLFIPKWAFIGRATVFVSALTAPVEQNGVPYCPGISTSFYITIQNLMTMDFHDVSIVKVLPSSNSVKIGELVIVNVTVRNEGTATENFVVSIYYDNFFVQNMSIELLEPYSSKMLTCIFDTSLLGPGNYTLTAFIPYLLNEADYVDNLFEDGVIEVRFRQYYLTIHVEPSDATFISGEGWYDEGSNVTLDAPNYVLKSAGVRYMFNHWVVNGIQNLANSITVIMNTNHTVTAYYTLQYYLTVLSSYGVAGGEGWYDANTIAYATLDAGVIDHRNNTRRVFTRWGGDAYGSHFMQSEEIFMDKPKTAVAVWKTQYYLTVKVDPSAIVMILGEGWYDQFENVTLTAPAVEGYDFNYWKVDETTQNAGTRTITVFMNAPHNATAYYHSTGAGAYFPWWSLFWYLLFPLALILVILLALLYRRRKKKKEDTFYRGWTAWYYCYDLRKRIR
ncbi:MAG: hypothetical protein QXN36_01225 [Candidatus Bathyarchaeia archaeon]